MRKSIISLVVIALLAMNAIPPACAGEGQVYGTLAGAGFGGLIGNQFGHGPGRVATTASGVFVGGVIGNDVGRLSDYAMPNQTAYTSSWYYPAPGPVTYGAAYVPTYVAPPAPPPEPPPIYIDADYGSYCREYSQSVRIGDQVQESYGTACLQPDGRWKAVR